jgi:hypothetical protein
MKPVTVEEALRYDKEALTAGIEKRKQNIKVFEEAIAKEHELIQREMQMITLIEAHKAQK